MQMFRCMYIRRDWKTDESIMEKMLNHYAIIQNESELPNNFQLILFPEGTNLTPETRKKSNAFAAQNNLKPLNHLLHPRTTGFSYIANKMRDSKYLTLPSFYVVLNSSFKTHKKLKQIFYWDLG